MYPTKEIILNAENVADTLRNQLEDDEDFQKYGHSMMLGAAEAHLKQMARNMNESAKKLRNLLNENTFDSTTTYEIGKCIQLMELDDIAVV